MIRIQNHYIEQDERFKTLQQYITVQPENLNKVTSFLEENNIEYEKASLSEHVCNSLAEDLTHERLDEETITKQEMGEFHENIYKAMIKNVFSEDNYNPYNYNFGYDMELVLEKERSEKWK